MCSRRTLWNPRESDDNNNNNNIDSIEKYTRIIYTNIIPIEIIIIVWRIIQRRIEIRQQLLSTTAKNVNVIIILLVRKTHSSQARIQ